MSVRNAAAKVELSDGDDIQKQRWFYARLSKSQAETMLCNEQSREMQTCTSKFLVSSLSSSKDYRMSIRRTIRKDWQAVEHITISYNEEDKSYGIKGQNNCQSVVEVVRNYITSCGYALEPFSGSFVITSTETNCKPSTESTQMLPAYTATMQYPTDTRSLPQVETKLDPLQGAKLKESFQESTSSSVPRFDGGESGCCCEVSCAPCVSLCDEFGFEDAGCLRSIYLGILFVIVVVCCGCCWLILSVTLERCSDKGIYDKCCDCCPRCCGCEEFCEEYNSCCDED